MCAIAGQARKRAGLGRKAEGFGRLVGAEGFGRLVGAEGLGRLAGAEGFGGPGIGSTRDICASLALTEPALNMPSSATAGTSVMQLACMSASMPSGLPRVVLASILRDVGWFIVSSTTAKTSFAGLGFHNS